MKAPFKFVFTAILTVIFVCILCPTAFADTEIELKVGDAEFDFASTSFVDVPVFVTKNSSGFIDMQFTVEFDADIFETAALAQVPQSSILCYNPDERVSSTDYPQISVGADNSTGTLRIAMSGVFKKDQNGNDAQHKFLGVGEMFRLKFKVKDSVSSIEKAVSKIKILLSSSSQTPFIMRTEQGAIALSNISVTDGSMTFKGITAPSSITITSSGSLMQGSSAKTAVDFVAQPVCTDGVYCEADIKWYVNGELGGSGLKYSYTPPNVNGTYAVTAKSGGIVSNEIIISVGQLYLPEAPEKEHDGQQFVGYHVNVSGNSMLLEAGSPFMGNANELKEIEPVWLSFEMADGAAVRMTAPAGLRFTTKVKYDEYSALVAAAGLSNVSFGTIIAPADYIGYGRNIEELTLEALAEWGGAYLKIPSTRWYDSDYSVNDGYYTYTGVIWNVLSSNYNRPFSGRGYVCVTYSDGTVKNFYTPHDENNNSRAVCDVAYAALTDSTAPYTEQQRSVMKTFVDGVVNITADGQPAWTGNSGYESPYVADQLITTEVISVIVSPKSGYSWNASDVRAVTYDGVRLMPQQYEVSGNDIVITIER